MKIQIEAEIFDDPDYCGDKNDSCSYERYVESGTVFNYNLCKLFEKKINHIYSECRCEKHNQCKEAWRQAKEPLVVEAASNWQKPEQ